MLHRAVKLLSYAVNLVVTMVSLFRKERGKQPKNQRREKIISQNSSRNIPEKKNLNVWLKLSWMKYTAEMRSSRIWKEVSIKVPTNKLQGNE